jgi:hypothetical protein
MANLAIGDKAIAFSLPGVDDKPHALADYAGSDLLAVIFYCNHCPYVLAWEDHGAPDDNYDDPGAVKSTYLRDALDALLADKAPAIAQTPPVGCTIKWRP